MNCPRQRESAEQVKLAQDMEFLQLVDDVVAQDIVYLHELPLEDGLAAMSKVQKIQYQKNKDRDNLLLKKGSSSRYFIVVVGRDRVEPKFAAIRTAFVADRADRLDTEAVLYEGGDALELRIPMSSFGENQRFRVASERQDRSSDYPVAAASVPSEGTLPQVGEVVKSETVEPYRKPGHVSYSAVEREMLPFNSTMDIPEYESLVSFSIQSIMTDWSAALDNFVQNPPVHKCAAWDGLPIACRHADGRGIAA